MALRRLRLVRRVTRRSVARWCAAQPFWAWIVVAVIIAPPIGSLYLAYLRACLRYAGIELLALVSAP